MSIKTNRARLTRRGVLAAGAGAGAFAATASEAAFLPAPETSERFDVVVVGAGMAGAAAALAAAEAGASVCVLEKAREARMGGNSALAGGAFAIPMDEGDAARAAFLSDFRGKAKGRGNPELFEIMADRSRDGVAWLAAHGVGFEPERRVEPYRVNWAVASPGFYMGMPRMLSGLRARIEENGGVYRFEVKARELLPDTRGGVAGVRAVGPDGVQDFEAGAVILAGGGYAGNTPLLEAFSDPMAGAMMVRGVPWATGDALEMARAAGAGWGGMGGLMALHVAAVDPVETAAGNPFSILPYTLSINREGQRFIDETEGYVAHGKAVLGQPRQTVSLVFDEAIAALPAAQATLGTFERLGIETVRAESLRELAAAIEVPADALEATVAAYNAAVSANGATEGLDPPKSALAQRIEGPGFRAIHPLVPGVTLTFGGISIDGEARVLEADGRAIPGLFAAGEGAGHAFYDDYVGGAALTNCLVMGRIAGISATGA